MKCAGGRWGQEMDVWAGGKALTCAGGGDCRTRADCVVKQSADALYS